MPFEEIFNFFIERHIVLKEDWLNAAIKSLRKSGISSNLRSAVYEQWLYSDLSHSSYPIFDQVGIVNDPKPSKITTPFVAQIKSVVDVGSSLYSQYKALTYEFIDNSGFDALPEQENPNEFAKPKRMLSFTISDGTSDARAIEHFSLPQMNLLLTPGCKVLFLPTIVSRRGILMLKGSNVQLLGGDVESFMKVGRPVEVMSVLLGIAAPIQNASKVTEEIEVETTEFLNMKSINQEMNRTLLQPSPNSGNHYLQDDDFEACSKEPSPADDYNMASIVESDDDNFGSNRRNKKNNIVEAPRGSQTLSSLFSTARQKQKKKNAIVEVTLCNTPKQSQTTRGCLSSVSSVQARSIRLEDSPPDFGVECPDYKPKRPDFPVSSKITRKRSSVLSKCLDSPSTSHSNDLSQLSWISPTGPDIVTKSERTTPKSPPPKKIASLSNIQRAVKLEIIDLSDDEVAIPSPASVHSAPSTPTVQPGGFLDNLCANSMSSAYCERFEKLKIVKIADASRRSRFVVGSIRCTVQAIVFEIQEALRIVDKVWTQKIQLMDESSSINCYVDNETLVSLIGLTTEQAMEIKKSSDSVRRQEGSRRLAAVQTQLQRLDLLFEIEFYSEGLAEAVVRSVQTLPQALEILS